MKRVLLVDDERDALEVLTWMMRDWGYSVESCDRVELAIRTAARLRPHVVVTDYLLGEDRTGVDLVRALRERQRRLPAILVTGLSSAQLQDLQSLEDVLTMHKPFRSDELRLLVERLTPWPRWKALVGSQWGSTSCASPAPDARCRPLADTDTFGVARLRRDLAPLRFRDLLSRAGVARDRSPR